MNEVQESQNEVIESSFQRHIRNQLHHQDPAFIKQILKYFDLFETYFRYEARGLEKIPKGQASIVVMNHGIIPYHGFLLTKKLVEKRGIYPRGLGAGFLFSIPLVREFFLKGGAVNAHPRNGRKLLQAGHTLLLAPGGIYEGLICHPGMIRVPWERRRGFVRLAVQTKTPIVPTYCAGINEVYFNSKFLLKPRIRFLESTRFSLPIFFGLGLLPFPIRLIHDIGDPIPITKKRRETEKMQVIRIHAEVLKTMRQMAEKSS